MFIDRSAAAAATSEMALLTISLIRLVLGRASSFSSALRISKSIMVDALSEIAMISCTVISGSSLKSMSALNTAFDPLTPSTMYSQALIIMCFRFTGTAFGLRQVSVRRGFNLASFNAEIRSDKYSSAQKIAKLPPGRKTLSNSKAQRFNNSLNSSGV